LKPAAALADGLAGEPTGGTHPALPIAEKVIVFSTTSPWRPCDAGRARARIVVLDCDAHQGSGTAALLAQDPGCVYVLDSA
jgi:hypothetical protein